MSVAQTQRTIDKVYEYEYVLMTLPGVKAKPELLDFGILTKNNVSFVSK